MPLPANATGRMFGAVKSLEALIALKPEGTETVRRLVAMLRYSREAVDVFNEQRDILVDRYSTGPDGKRVIEPDPLSGAPSFKITNGPEFDLKVQELYRAPADVGRELPAPFTWSEITTLFAWPKGKVDGDVVAKLGPFYSEA